MIYYYDDYIYKKSFKKESKKIKKWARKRTLLSIWTQARFRGGLPADEDAVGHDQAM